MRLRFYELASQGNEQQALAEQEKLITDAQQQMVSVLKDLDGAIAYIIAGENQHPNRVDVCTEPDTTSRSQTQAFGTPAPTSGFGQPSSFQSRPMAPNNQGQSAFGRPSAFSSNALSTIANPFAKPTAPVAATQLPSNPFGHQQSSAAAGAFGQPAPAAISGFTQASSTNPFAQATQNTSTPMLSSPMSRHSALATTDSRGNVISWGGKKVVYIDDEPCFRRNDGRWERIWFPSGCPLAKDPDLPLDAYDQAVEQEYKHIKDHGTFAGGKMPMLPPKKEWCDWDF